MDMPATMVVKLMRIATLGLAVLFVLAAGASLIAQALPGAAPGGPTGVQLLVPLP